MTEVHFQQNGGLRLYKCIIFWANNGIHYDKAPHLSRVYISAIAVYVFVRQNI